MTLLRPDWVSLEPMPRPKCGNFAGFTVTFCPHCAGKASNVAIRGPDCVCCVGTRHGKCFGCENAGLQPGYRC